MSDKTDQDAAERHSATLQLAYHLWEQAGRPLGQDQHFWDLAQAKMAEAHWTPPSISSTSSVEAAGLPKDSD